MKSGVMLLSIDGIECKAAKDTGEMVKAVEGKFRSWLLLYLKSCFLNLLLYSFRQDREDVPVANLKPMAMLLPQ